MPKTSDISPPKASPHLNWGWGSSDLFSQLNSGATPPDASNAHPPLSHSGAENEAGKGPLLKAAEGVQENFWGGLKNILDSFLPTVSQKRDIAVYGLALLVFVVALMAILK